MKYRWIHFLLLIGLVLLFESSCSKDDGPKGSGTFTDIDNNLYHTVKICDQVWMVENLKVERFRNGDDIPYVRHDDWDYEDLIKTAAYGNYGDSYMNGDIYGHLYNWYAVNDSRNLAPEGWHIPSDVEWETLMNCLGGLYEAGGRMKEKGTEHWDWPNVDATNESGFTALPGDYRQVDYDSEKDLGNIGIWWTSTLDSNYALNRKIYSGSASLNRFISKLNDGLSVRCLKD